MAIDYRIEFARTLSEVEVLRPVWSVMQCQPDTDIDLYETVVSTRSNVLRPQVATLYKDGQPIAMLISRIEETFIVCKIGYFVLCRVPARSLTVLQGGLVGNITGSEAELLLSSAMQTLRRGDADVAHFLCVRTDSELHLAIRRIASVFVRNLVAPASAHWVMDLPGNPEEYWKEMRLRHRAWVPHMRRYKKLLNRDFAGNVDFWEYHESVDVEQLFHDAERVAHKTYQRALGVGFEDNQENRKRLSLYARNRRLRACILYVGGEPASFWIGSVYGDTFYLAFLGFDPELSRYSPGNLVFMHMTERLTAENVRHLDFGMGEAFYKKRFGTTCWKESSTYVFAPRLRCTMINILYTTTAAIDLAGRRLLRNLKLLQRAKTFWRKQLVKTHPGDTTLSVAGAPRQKTVEGSEVRREDSRPGRALSHQTKPGKGKS